ncbi:hypothetical protein BDZ97DRAFT_1899993 [Flammula alnicola]|nr:hypothetical protein BDZ97DRAFT_1899993 [Flammula alnicola]
MTGPLNVAAPGISYFTPLQNPPAGTAINPQPSGNPVPKLFQPLNVRGVQFPNRIFLSPLCQYSAENGIVTPWHLAHLGGILTRGPGLTFVEATAVVPEGRISPDDVGIWSDAHVKPLAQIVEFAHSQGQKIAIQLGHAGRKASTIAPYLYGPPLAPKAEGGWPDDVWGPSTVPFHESFAQPRELTLEGIKRVVTAFADGAKRAIAAGFDVIEIHGAHGFLLFENRIRLTLEVVDAIRAVIPKDTPLFLRISGTEWLEEHGVDLLDVSAGGNDIRQKIRPGPGYQVPFAEAAKKAVGSKMLVGAVGGLYEGKVAAGVLESGRADAIFVGRYFQKNPGHLLQMAEDVGVELHWAKQIQWGFTGRGIRGLGSSKKD